MPVSSTHDSMYQEIQELTRKLERSKEDNENLLAELAHVKRERNVAASASGQGTWIWSDTDPNSLTSMTNDMIVTMRAGQLRELLRAAKRLYTAAQHDLERERVRLAGCGVAAIDGSAAQEVKPGDYGYSAAYGDVRKLRRNYDRALSDLAAAKAVVEAVRDGRYALQRALRTGEGVNAAAEKLERIVRAHDRAQPAEPAWNEVSGTLPAVPIAEILQPAEASPNSQATKCVRCGAPYAPSGRCSRWNEGCQGGRGENAACHATDRERLETRHVVLEVLHELVMKAREDDTRFPGFSTKAFATEVIKALGKKGDVYATRFVCKACGKPLLLENLYCDDGCPCNSPKGVNFEPIACRTCNEDCVKPGHRLELLFPEVVR